MQEFIAYTIYGIVTASIYAIAASGLVVTYTTSGVFNLAHGAVGMFGAFVYWQLRFGWHVPAWLALILVVLVLAPLFGCAIDKVIMRGLADATEATKLAVTIGVLVALVGAALWIWDPNKSRRFPAFYTGHKVKILGTFVTADQLITIGLGLLVAVGLRILLYRTRIGLDMRAVVDDRSLVLLNGGRPDRASMTSWAVGSSLASLAGILIAPYLQLSVVPLTLLVVNAYAAAVIGKLRSLPLTIVGALIIGLLQSYAIGYLPTSKIIWLQNVPDTIPIIVLFIALLVLPHQRLRGAAARRLREAFPVPTYKTALIGAVVVIALAAVLAPLLSTQPLFSLSSGLGLGIVGLSLVPLLGYGGQISLCQMTYAGVGALVYAHATSHGNLFGLVLAFVAAAFVGGLTALPAIRLRGLYLALATAAVAEFFDNFFFALPSLTFFGYKVPIFRNGTLPTVRINVPGVDAGDDRVYFVMLAVIFVLVGIGVVALRRSRYGRMLIAMRESPAACAMLGLRLTTVKLAVFALSAGIAGIGGVVLAGLSNQVAPDSYSFFQSLPLLLLIMAGGVGLVSGAFFGAVALGLFSALGAQSQLFSRISQLLPGLVGIGLGQQPNGVAADIGAGLSGLAKKRFGRAAPAGAGTDAATEALHVAAGVDVDGVAPDSMVTDVRWEWAGLDGPLTPRELQLLDTGLGIGADA
jgi:branched-chain amino acid transport system permease protein